jgi:GT2 family glycosyltransferase
MTSVAVVVLTWNGQEYVQPCLAALQRQHYDDTYAVLVVDNGSTDETVARVEQHFPQVALIRNESNLGFARGNNVGIRALLAQQAPAPIDFVPDIIVLLNQDTEVEPEWLTQLVQGFDHPEQPGIVGSKIFFPDGNTLQHTGGEVIWPLAIGRHRGSGELDEGQYEQAETVDYVTGAAMAIRRAVLEQVGLLDEGFTPAYFEDTDFCYRARAAGFAVMYIPTACLRHDENSSLQAQSARHQRAYHRNRIRFLLKHGSPEQLLTHFAPAEHEEIQRWSIADSLARKGAYLDNLLALSGILRQRADIADPTATSARLIALLRQLHQAATEDEHFRRGESIRRLPAVSPPSLAPDDDAAEPDTPDEEPEAEADDTAKPAASAEPEPEAKADDTAKPAASAEPTPETAVPPLPQPITRVDMSFTDLHEPAEPPVDVAAIMRQVRRQISERQGHQIDHDMTTALHHANQQWNAVYEPLNLPSVSSVQGWAWHKLRDRLHAEVRSYLDPMMYRQTEFNASVVRVLNNLMRRSNFAATTAEIESLRDELMQMREQVRQIQEQHEQR